MLKRPLAAFILAGFFFTPLHLAKAGEWLTTSSLVEEEAKAPEFTRYPYVNPDAPKGGTYNSIVSGSTFDSFNPFIVRGTPAAGLTEFGGFLYDTLMQQSLDKASTSHPLVAEAFKYPEDYSSATYRIDKRAKFHDGEPITSEDVIWSFQQLKEISQMHNRYYANVTEAVALNDHEVEFRFDQKGNRELPHIMGDLPILPKHWFEGTDAQGKKRDITQPSLERPVGSGPYQIESFKPGEEIIWSRVKDYWGAEVPVNVGRNNYDRKKYIYIQDDNAAWQAFTKGGFQDFKSENSARRWNTEYDFPAFKAGDVIKHIFEQQAGQPMQGYFWNTRRPQFQDPRVREALSYAYDFESMNRTLFFNSYTRTKSYFEGGELASSGIPTGRELEILNEFKDQLPPRLFTDPYEPPVNADARAQRENLRKASQLLKEAGWSNKGGALVNDKTGEPMRIEFLTPNPESDRVTMPYIQNLKKLGIDATLRVVDPTQYVNRVRSFDYDVITAVTMQSQSPGNEQRDFWSEAAADRPDSRNYAGIKNPVVEKLIDKIIYAKDRDELVAATHALDRVLLWNFYALPQFYSAGIRAAYWNKFGIPETQPLYIGVDIDSWWIDVDKEKALAAKYRWAN